MKRILTYGTFDLLHYGHIRLIFLDVVNLLLPAFLRNYKVNISDCFKHFLSCFVYGHIRLLKRAKAMGDYLIVALSTDEFNAGKGKKGFAESLRLSTKA